MSIPDIDSLAAALEGGDVPAQVGFPSFAGCLINNAETIFHLPELRQAYLLMCAATTGLKAGAGMDLRAPLLHGYLSGFRRARQVDPQRER